MRHVGVGALAAGMLLALALAPARADSLAANMNPNLCIDWNTGNNGVALWQCHGGYNQNFFTAMAMSQPRYGNLCLDQVTLNPGAPLAMMPCANKPSQAWQMVANPNDPSYGRYRNAAGYCANIPNGNAQQGTPVIAWPCQTGPAPNDIWLPRIAQASVAPNPQGPVAQQPFVPRPPALPNPTGPVQGPAQGPGPGQGPGQGPQAQQPLPPPPPPPGQPAPPIDRSPVQLEAMGEMGDVVAQGLSVVADMQAFADALRASSTGPTPLWDPQYVATLDAAINYARQMIAGPNNPYSLQKLASGSVVALNEEERREFNVMFAKFGLREQFRRVHAAYSQHAAMAVPVESGRAWLSPASGRLGRPPLISVQGGDGRTVAALSRQIVPRMDGYDRAQQLATTLNFMRTTNVVKIFADYQLLAESTATAYVERLVGRIESAATGGAAQSAATTKLLRILKAYNFAKIAVQMTASALNAVVALSPSSVGGFYMTINDRSYERAGQPPYPLTVNNSAVAHIYVVPRAPGGTVDTPLGIIDKLTVLGMGPRVSAVIQRMPLGRELLQGLEAEFKVLIKGLAKYHTDTALSLMANTKMSTWAAAIQDTFQISAFNYAPVEVNDARVVRLTPSPGIAITQNPDFRYSVRGVTAGQHGIKGELLMYDLYNGGGATTFNIAIEVGGGPPPSTGTAACFARGVQGFCTIDKQCTYGGLIIGTC